MNWTLTFRFFLQKNREKGGSSRRMKGPSAHSPQGVALEMHSCPGLLCFHAFPAVTRRAGSSWGGSLSYRLYWHYVFDYLFELLKELVGEAAPCDLAVPCVSASAVLSVGVQHSGLAGSRKPPVSMQMTLSCVFLTPLQKSHAWSL